MYFLRDAATKRAVTTNSFVYAGAEGPWEVVMDIDQIRSKINADFFRKAPPFASKYLPFMPIKNYSEFVSLDEGATPLIRSKRLGEALGIDLWFKLEPQNPTGSFKDRGSAVDLTIAREVGAKAVTVASTGNMAASCSCYAAAAQIPCFVFVPEGTPQSKLSQVIAFGGKIVQVKGSYNDAARLAQQVAEDLNFYLAGDYAFRVEGQKTAAFEICDQLFFQAPDAVVIPMGCGTNMTAYGKGFAEYRELGFIDRVPQLIGVQASGANAIVRSFERGQKTITPLASINTIASAIAVADPLDGIKALEAIYGSGGRALEVSDEEMYQALYQLSKEEGLFVEASCASAIAALIKLTRDGSWRGKRVVVVLTGDGLKDPSSILKVALKPPTIHPEVGEFLSLFKNRYFEGDSVSFFRKGDVVFEREPTVAKVRERVAHYFRATYADAHLETMRESCSRFLKKGKPVSFADFQDIVQNALEKPAQGGHKVLAVEDFEITTGMDTVPQARVVVRVEGELREERADGVGPVDAVINALRLACRGHSEFKLVGYRVDIRSEGTDAVTTTEMKLTRGAITSVAHGTSPDIIQASIEAFEEAYNGLFRE